VYSHWLAGAILELKAVAVKQHFFFTGHSDWYVKRERKKNEGELEDKDNLNQKEFQIKVELKKTKEKFPFCPLGTCDVIIIDGG